jgi:hypothetical protein
MIKYNNLKSCGRLKQKKRKVEEKNVDANPEDGGVVEIDVDQSK